MYLLRRRVQRSSARGILHHVVTTMTRRPLNCWQTSRALCSQPVIMFMTVELQQNTRIVIAQHGEYIRVAPSLCREIMNTTLLVQRDISIILAAFQSIMRTIAVRGG